MWASTFPYSTLLISDPVGFCLPFLHTSKLWFSGVLPSPFSTLLNSDPVGFYFPLSSELNQTSLQSSLRPIKWSTIKFYSEKCGCQKPYKLRLVSLQPYLLHSKYKIHHMYLLTGWHQLATSWYLNNWKDLLRIDIFIQLMILHLWQYSFYINPL